MSEGMLSEIERVRTSELRPYPGNARRGDVKAIATSLRKNGQFQPIIVQKSTGYILVGNHTHKAMQELRWAEASVAYVDVDDETAKRIVLAANRTADLATYDLDALAALVSSVDDLEGTGFTPDDLAGLMSDEPTLGDGDEEEGDDEKLVRYGVVVYTRNEAETLKLMAEMIEKGWDARAL
jgi:ParB-like chromosome segregation protein Spo0J